MQGDRKGPHSLKVQVIERVELFLHSGLDRSVSRWLRHWRQNLSIGETWQPQIDSTNGIVALGCNDVTAFCPVTAFSPRGLVLCSCRN